MATLTPVITLSIRIGQPVSEPDRRTLERMRERVRVGLPITDVHLLDEDENEVYADEVSP